MKYTKILFALSLFIGSACSVQASEDYITGCYYEVRGDRTTYKYRTIEDEKVMSYSSATDIAPSDCIKKAKAAVKQTYTTQFLAGGSFQNTTYRNKTVTIHVTHKDNVDFPRQALELAIVQDPDLSLRNGFSFVESWLSDNYYEAKIAHVN